MVLRLILQSVYLFKYGARFNTWDIIFNFLDSYQSKYNCNFNWILQIERFLVKIKGKLILENIYSTHLVTR